MMEWLTPELIDKAMEHWRALGIGGGMTFFLLIWLITCKYGMPGRKKG